MPRGGRRPGAGRPKGSQKRQKPDPSQAAATLALAGVKDSKEFLEQVLAGDRVPTPIQMDAARSLLPFQHKKLGEAGKKEQRNEAAKSVGRFTPQPPRLAAVAGKKV